jgi:hypothetical protein
MIYKWKEGARVSIDPQAAGEEIERVRVAQNGRLLAPDLVESARDPSSPLHPAFEWDDATAAENWRVEQASYLIRSIEVIVERQEEERPIRAFVSVKRDEDRSYTSVSHAMADPDLRQQVLAGALKELEAWRVRYAELVELAKVFAAIDEARAANE